jgi:hypothetical protein
MQPPKTAKPASGLSAEPVSKSEQLGGRLDSTNNPKPAEPQAPDAFGENDELFFRRRPGARQRLRLPFDAELPIEVWQPAAAAGLAAFVIVSMTRDAEGAPTIISRQFVLAEGGTA